MEQLKFCHEHKNEIANIKEDLKEIKEKVENNEGKLQEYITKTEKQDVKILAFERNFQRIERVGYGIIATILLANWRAISQLIFK